MLMILENSLSDLKKAKVQDNPNVNNNNDNNNNPEVCGMKSIEQSLSSA